MEEEGRKRGGGGGREGIHLCVAISCGVSKGLYLQFCMSSRDSRTVCCVNSEMMYYFVPTLYLISTDLTLVHHAAANVQNASVRIETFCGFDWLLTTRTG